MTAMAISTGDGVSTYTYDTENRLVTATGLGHSATYAYDPLGRRRSKTVDGVTTQYLGDGDREIAEYDGAGTLLLRYVYGPGIDEPLAVVTPASAHTFTHQDGLGSVIALSDDSRTVTDRYSYGAYGESAMLAGTAFRFTGRRLDPETGLYYYRARYYSPTLGRFLQTDPVSYDGGLNLYAYVDNDPLNRTDPNGLWAQQVGNAGWDLIKSAADYAYNNPGQVLGVGLAGAGLVACTLSPCVAVELAVGAGGAAVAEVAVTATGAASAAAAILGGATILLSESQDPNNAGGSQGSSGSSAPSGSTPTVGDLTAGSRVISQSESLLQLERSGGLNEANRLFDQLAAGLKVAEHPTAQGVVRSIDLPGGGTASVRPFSTGGSPTIQINIPGRPPVKIRFP